MEALENILEALDVVLEAMLGQDSSKQAHESENLEKHKENQGFLASRGGVLGVSWRLLEASWRVFEASWRVLGASWRPTTSQEAKKSKNIEKTLKKQRKMKKFGRWKCALKGGVGGSGRPGLILLLEGSSKKKGLIFCSEHAHDSPRWSGGSKKASPIPPTP